MTLSLLSALALGADLRVPSAYPSLQAADDAAQPGDRILLDPGDYCENPTLRTAGLTVEGAGRGVTRLVSCNLFAGSTVTLDGSADVTFRALTFDGQYFSRGVRVTGSAVLRTDDVAFVAGGQLGTDGAGVYVESGASAVIDRTHFCANVGLDFFGAGGDGAGLAHDGPVTVTRSVFVRNDGRFDGGAILARGPLVAHHNTFVGNDADDGEAITVDGTTAELVNNLFVGHTSDWTVAIDGSGTLPGSTTNGFHGNGRDSEVAMADTLSGDPGFVAVGSACDDYDLQLTAGSPYLGVAHDVGLHDDLGAYDFVEPDPDADGDGVTVGGGDCADDDPDVFPGASEACNGIDDDCDGVVDEGCPTGPTGDTAVVDTAGTGPGATADTGLPPGTIDTGPDTGSFPPAATADTGQPPGGTEPDPEPTPTPGPGTSPTASTAPGDTPLQPGDATSTEGIQAKGGCACDARPSGGALGGLLLALPFVRQRRRARSASSSKAPSSQD